MAKKKTKKPVSKRVSKPRTTRATLEQRNEALGQPKTRKPRAKKIKQDSVEVTITEGPATQWVSGSADDFLDDNHPQVVSKVVSWVPSEEASWVSSTEPAAPSIPTSGSVFIPNYPDQKVEFTKVNKNGWVDAAGEVYDDFICKMQKSEFTTTVRDFAFAHPMIFGIAFCTGILCVLTVTAVAARYFGW